LITRYISKPHLAKVTHQTKYKRFDDLVGLCLTHSSSAALLSWASAASRCSSLGIDFIAWCERKQRVCGTLLSLHSQSVDPELDRPHQGCLPGHWSETRLHWALTHPDVASYRAGIWPRCTRDPRCGEQPQPPQL